MSDTDDTDDLLLIPPDFFVIDSELELDRQSEVPYFKVFDSIITQVSNLEKRLDYIEYTSDLSLADSSVDNLHIEGGSSVLPMFNSPKHVHSEYVPYSYRGTDSTQSTPQKPRTKFKLNSLPSSPNEGRYSPRKPRINLFAPKTPAANYAGDYNKEAHSSKEKVKNQKDDEQQYLILGEIDNFISNVRTIQRLNTAKSLSNVNLDSKNPDVGDINTLTKFKNDVPEHMHKQKTWRCGDDISTVPDYGTGMRAAMHGNSEQSEAKLEQPFVQRHLTSESTSSLEHGPLTSERSVPGNNDSFCTDDVSLSSSDSTQTTALPNMKETGNKSTISPSEVIHSNALKALDLHKRLLSQSVTPPPQESHYVGSNKPDYNPINMNSNTEYIPPRIDDLKLFSLKDLWGSRESGKASQKTSDSTLLLRLEEEKLRRQHCEQLIKQLQVRTLELQERLAVALEVDQAKDEAIHRFHSAWENVAAKLQALNNEKTRIEKEVDKITEQNRKDLEEATQKVTHYEKEASKALALAHSNQEKLVSLERQSSDFQNQVQLLEGKLNMVQNSYTTEVEKNKQFTEIIAQKEIELNENKTVLATARKEVAQSKRAVEVCQAEFTSLKTECAHLQLLLNEERRKYMDLDGQNRKLLSEIDTHKKNEKTFKAELEKSKQQIETHKTELRNFYQNQVETVVRDKLQEFQAQLERAETALQEELKNREFSIARTAAMHIQKISEKHSLEVQLLEEKHTEEVRLYQLQLSQNEQHIQNLQCKLQDQQERRAHIAQQLHNVMEAQWREAIKIINNTKSPVFPNSNDFSTIDQLNSLRSKSHLNLDQLLSFNTKNDQHLVETKSRKAAESNYNHRATNIDALGSVSSVIEDNYRDHLPYQLPAETPVTSKPQRNKKQEAEHELQKYIQLLLNKSSPESGEQKRDTRKAAEMNDDDRTETNTEEQKGAKGATKERRSGKPPWK